MPLTSIVVVQNDGKGIGDDFFMDGLFTTPAGKIGTPLRTQTGAHDFMKLDAAGNPQWHARQVVAKPPGNDNSNPVTVTLQLVAAIAGATPGPMAAAARRAAPTAKTKKPKQARKLGGTKSSKQKRTRKAPKSKAARPSSRRAQRKSR